MFKDTFEQYHSCSEILQRWRLGGIRALAVQGLSRRESKQLINELGRAIRKQTPLEACNYLKALDYYVIHETFSDGT